MSVIDSSCIKQVAMLLLEMSEIMQIISREVAVFLPIVLSMLLQTPKMAQKKYKIALHIANNWLL